MKRLLILSLVFFSGCASHRVSFVVGHDGHNPTFQVQFDPKENVHADKANTSALTALGNTASTRSTNGLTNF